MTDEKWNTDKALGAIIALSWVATRVIQALPTEARKAVVARVSKDLDSAEAAALEHENSDWLAGQKYVLEGIQNLASRKEEELSP